MLFVLWVLILVVSLAKKLDKKMIQGDFFIRFLFRCDVSCGVGNVSKWGL